MKKKLIILLMILMVLSIAIGVSPIVEYFHANAAEETLSSADVVTSETAPITTEEAPREPNQTAVLSAVVLATGTILIALVLFIKQRDPENG